jgi:hypothetical protein
LESYYSENVERFIRSLSTNKKPSPLRDFLIRGLTASRDGAREQVELYEEQIGKNPVGFATFDGEPFDFAAEAEVWRDRQKKYAADLAAITLPS